MFWMRSTRPLTPPAGSGAPGGLRAGVGRKTSSEKLASCEPRQRGDANQVETVLRGLERERGLAVAFGLLTADRIELRAHRVVDVDRGVELPAGRQVERDPLRAGGAQAVPDGGGRRHAARGLALPLFERGADRRAVDRCGQVVDDLRVGAFVVGRCGDGRGGRGRQREPPQRRGVRRAIRRAIRRRRARRQGRGGGCSRESRPSRRRGCERDGARESDRSPGPCSPGHSIDSHDDY